LFENAITSEKANQNKLWRKTKNKKNIK